MSPSPAVLLLTVGTGTAEQLEDTVLKPFAKSFRKGQWARVVLFPSQTTGPNAERLREAHPDLPIQVRSLRKPGLEEDVDACFAHFDAELVRLQEEGFDPAQMTADLTRGTKAMSAGLALAAAAHGVGCLRYVGASKRDDRGMALPGHETVSDLRPGSVLERHLIARGVDFLRSGDFRAAARLFPGGSAIRYVTPRAHEIQWLQWTAAFWGAWDSFDYKEASRLARRDTLPKRQPKWAAAFLPADPHLTLLKGLAGNEPKDRHDKADACRDLAADLLANAERRLREGQTEETLVRLYRVIELVGQLRLFNRGYDSGRLPANDPEVVKWYTALESPPRPDKDGQLQIGREQAASFLCALNDPLGPKLHDLGWLGEFQPRLRNKSILIHGFKSRTRGKEADVRRLLKQLSEFFDGEDAHNPARRAAAHFAFMDQT